MQSWNRFVRSGKTSGEYWLTVSDLMAALMVIFLFIAIAFMMRVQKVVVAWQETETDIIRQLSQQFERNLEDWNAEFDRERLTIRFNDPETLFEQGKSALKPAFKGILDQFCPKYFAILDNYIGDLDEVRIEGHTSPEWNEDTSSTDAFFNNMRLSQSRTRAVMEYCFRQDESRQYGWLHSLTRSVGMSSAQLQENDEGQVDYERSRRVEFRIKTKAEERIASILRGWQ
ncbi:OmpA/MotB family protein [Microbulbifer marinus]|uniref:OmpA family protein n=1 Tax=Microbulbifer marinus TaxID=658218 RepID=A0A1H3ZA50_9GAMM|nr:OmpA family protein [Microbulbifer marinus]SEA20557.1 OmpA family protein [Microbulbifer marinus]